ncbi:hypothetical protein Xen7305DRAFT_00048640 [Xenococcus sp. PCC 7305]|nr:hypothetical protein Xen7305DRAFT_00048640 [Xenococcus sp. PCC 7305]
METLDIEKYLQKYDEITIEKILLDLKISNHPLKGIRTKVEYEKLDINDKNFPIDKIHKDSINAAFFIINNPDEYFIEGDTSLEFLLLWADLKETTCSIGLSFLLENQLRPFLKEILEKGFIDEIMHDFIINMADVLLATWQMLYKYSNIIEQYLPNFFSDLGYLSYSPLEIFQDIVRYKFEDPLYLCLNDYYVSSNEDYKKLAFFYNKDLKKSLFNEERQKYQGLLKKHIPNGHLEGKINHTFYSIASLQNIEPLKELYEFKQQAIRKICRLQIETNCNPKYRPLKLLSNKWSEGKII